MKDLSIITKIGTEIPVEGFCKIRLLDTNYNGTGTKCWQFVDFVRKNVYLGYPNDRNTNGYPTAKKMQETLNEVFDKLPKWLKDQIIETKVPCYIPATKRNRLFKTKLFLLSATELCQNGYEIPFEGRPLEYYINHLAQYNGWQWLRSPHRSYSYHAWFLIGSGYVGIHYAYFAYAVAPAFTTK